MKIIPIILSGGSGMRLWPLSRALNPKQLLALGGDRTLLQETAARVSGAPFGAPLVVCNDEHRFTVAAQLGAAGASPTPIHRMWLVPSGFAHLVHALTSPAVDVNLPPRTTPLVSRGSLRQR